MYYAGSNKLYAHLQVYSFTSSYCYRALSFILLPFPPLIKLFQFLSLFVLLILIKHGWMGNSDAIRYYAYSLSTKPGIGTRLEMYLILCVAPIWVANHISLQSIWWIFCRRYSHIHVIMIENAIICIQQTVEYRFNVVQFEMIFAW